MPTTACIRFLLAHLCLLPMELLIFCVSSFAVHDGIPQQQIMCILRVPENAYLLVWGAINSTCKIKTSATVCESAFFCSHHSVLNLLFKHLNPLCMIHSYFTSVISTTFWTIAVPPHAPAQQQLAGQPSA